MRPDALRFWPTMHPLRRLPPRRLLRHLRKCPCLIIRPDALRFWPTMHPLRRVRLLLRRLLLRRVRLLLRRLLLRRVRLLLRRLLLRRVRLLLRRLRLLLRPPAAAAGTAPAAGAATTPVKRALVFDLMHTRSLSC